MAIQESVCFGKHLNGRHTLDTQTTSVIFGYQTGSAVFASAYMGESAKRKKLKGLILAQNERWRRGLGMQVERE